jgi:tetratricopeptide (TPR) repeat protein
MSKTPVITRKDMKEPDRFQQAATQAATWIAARKRHVVAAGASVVAVLIAIAVLAAVQASRASKAGAAASDLLATVGGDISSVPLPGMPGPFFPSDEARQRAVIEAADRLLAEYPRTVAGALAALVKGDAHLRLREWDAAKGAYDRFLGASDPTDSMRFGALEGLAIAAEGKGDLAGAAQTYERLAREAPAFADRADLGRARVLAAAGKADEAKQLLAAFSEKHKDSLLVGEASARLARLGGK